MGSFKMKTLHHFDFSNFSNDMSSDDEGDDEISDDEVFVRDLKGNHTAEQNGVHKPLMAPRHKNHSKDNANLHTRIRQVPPVRVLLAPLFYFCMFIAAVIGIVCVVVYLVNEFGVNILSHSVLKTVQFTSCTNASVEDVWSHTFPMLGTESAFRLVDVNDDNVSDVIFGFSTGIAAYKYPKITCDIYFNGIKECGGGVLALDGKNGTQIWRHYTENEIFALNCNFDIDNDGVYDCIAAGRVATLVAISGKNGTRLWTFDDKNVKVTRSNVYTPQYIRDVDGDGLKDLLVMHGGDPLKKPGDKHNLPARLVVLSLKTGKVLKWVKVPDGFESYYSPQILLQPDGSELVLYGTGGETHGGSLWYIRLSDLLNGDMNMSHQLYQDSAKGIMVPPAIVDVTKDGIPDIIMTMFNSNVVAFDGLTLKQIWNFTFSESETYSTPAVGYFNDDDVSDFIVSYQKGPGFPVYYYSQTTILDGKSGQPVFQEPIKSQIAVQSSPLAISMEGYGNDAFLYWQSNCHGNENSSSEFNFLKGTSIHKQTRVNFCKERFGDDSFYSQLYLTSQALGQPGVLIYDSDQRKNIEYAGNLNYEKIGQQYLKDHPNARELYEKEMAAMYDDHNDDVVEDQHFSSYEYLPESESVIPEAPELNPQIQNPYQESQVNVQYPLFHNVRKHGRFGQDRNWRLHTHSKPKNRYSANHLPKSYTPHDVYYPQSNQYEQNKNDDYNQGRWKERFGNHHQQRYPDPSNTDYFYKRQQPAGFHYNRRKWPSSRNHLRRGKRHVGFHDGEGVQRVISTGTLAPALNNINNDSIDIIFATYWFHPQKALTILPEDSKCIEDRMKNEEERFKLYKDMDHDEYEEKVTVECLKKNGRYNDKKNILDDPPYDPFNVSMGMMTVYRVRISCSCDSVKKDSVCAKVLPWHKQGWPSYMGQFGNSYFVSKNL